MLKQRLGLSAIRLFSTARLPRSEKLSTDRKSGWGEANSEGEVKNAEFPTSYLRSQNLCGFWTYAVRPRTLLSFPFTCVLWNIGPSRIIWHVFGLQKWFWTWNLHYDKQDSCDSIWGSSRSMADQSAVDLIWCGQQINVCPQNNYWNETGVCSQQNKPPWRNTRLDFFFN